MRRTANAGIAFQTVRLSMLVDLVCATTAPKLRQYAPKALFFFPLTFLLGAPCAQAPPEVRLSSLTAFGVQPRHSGSSLLGALA